MPEVSKRAQRKDSATLDSIRHASGTGEVNIATDVTYPNEYSFVTRIELAGLSDEAKLACEKYVRKFASDLAGEATRLEEIGRPIDVLKPEITAATISIAYKGVIQRQTVATDYGRRRARWADRGVQILATLGAVATGVCAGYLHAKWQVALFTVLAVLSGLSAIYVIMRQK